jgi:tripartite-type tricarboxylate transporter receptor subunit TctC
VIIMSNAMPEEAAGRSAMQVVGARSGRRRAPWLAVAVAAAATVCSTQAAAQSAYPTRLIRIVVPTVAGGSTTMIARLVSEHFTKVWGQSVIVDNRPGGNTVVGTEYVARAAPDGYTLLVPSITHIVLPLITSTPYDPIKSFVPISGLASQMYVMLVHPSVPARSVKELIALAKARPGQIDYSISGAASGGRIGAELFSMAAGVRLQMIPYKGGAQAMADLIGGQVQLSYQAPITSMPHIESGRLRALGVTGPKRSRVLPDLPTMAEAGLKGAEMLSWQALFAPAATPPEVVSRLSQQVRALLGSPEVSARLASHGVDAYPTTPEEFLATMQADSARIARVVKAAGIRIEN